MGKSTLAGVLAICVAALPAGCFPRLGGAPPTHVLSGDAYHMNEDSLAAQPGLKARKGRADTFRPEQLLRDLHQLRAGDTEVHLPVYDRTLHEPVPDVGGTVVAGLPALVIIEGIHLLHRGDRWSEVRDALDLTIALVPASAALARQRLIARKMGGGKTHEAAAQHYERVDLPNVRAHALARGEATLCLCFADNDDSERPSPTPGAVAGGFFELRDASSAISAAEAAQCGVQRAALPRTLAPLLVIGLNPAYQRTMCVPRLTPDAVSRATRLKCSAGGKGQHCAIAANIERRGAASLCQLLGAAGDSGRYVHAALARVVSGNSSGDEAARAGAAGGEQAAEDRELTVWVEGYTTRTCTTVLSADDGSSTELIDPSETVDPEVAAQLRTTVLRAVKRWVPPQACGACPPACSKCLPRALHLEVPASTCTCLRKCITSAAWH